MSSNKLHIVRKNLKKYFEKIGVEISTQIIDLWASKYSAFLKILKPQLIFFHKSTPKLLKIEKIFLKIFGGIKPSISLLSVNYNPIV